MADTNSPSLEKSAKDNCADYFYLSMIEMLNKKNGLKVLMTAEFQPSIDIKLLPKYLQLAFNYLTSENLRIPQKESEHHFRIDIVHEDYLAECLTKIGREA